MPVAYGTATTSGGAPPVALTCTPESNSTFKIGTTAVTCTATDARQRADACTFNIVVLQPPKVQFARYAAFGDSITWGENGIANAAYGYLPYELRPHFQVMQNYPTLLYQSLAARYSTQSISVGNFGAPGEKASDSATRPRFSSVLRTGAWDVVLLMEGSNDVSAQDSRTIAAAIEGLRTMVRDAKSRNVLPFLATIPPMDGSACCPRRGSAAPLVPGFNDQIRSVAASEGVPLVDVYAAFPSPASAYLSVDGLHPNEQGYGKIADTFFGAIKDKLEIKPATTAMPTTTLAVPQSASPYTPARRRR